MAVKKSAVTMIIRRLSFILPDGVTENHVNNLYHHDPPLLPLLCRYPVPHKMRQFHAICKHRRPLQPVKGYIMSMSNTKHEVSKISHPLSSSLKKPAKITCHLCFIYLLCTINSIFHDTFIFLFNTKTEYVILCM